MSAHEVLAVGREGTHGARAALGRSHIAAAQLLEDPRGEALGVWLAVISDERVKFRILERLGVEARGKRLELLEADALDEAARRRVGRVRLADHVQRHALRRH